MRALRSALLLILSTIGFVACSSGTTKAGSDSFAAIAARSEELRSGGITEASEYRNLAADFQALVERNPNLVNEDANKKLAADLVAKYPPLNCPLNIMEPAETLRTLGGFISPVSVASDCPATAPFLFEADSADLALTGEDLAFSYGKMRARIRVNSATLDAEKNRIRFSARYYAADFLSALRIKFGIAGGNSIAVNPPAYQLQATATDKDAYADMRSRFRKAKYTREASGGSLGSDVALSANGQFTVGGSYAGKKFDLLYGHPNGQLPDGIGTTFTTVRVDGTDYRLEELRGKPGELDGALVYEAKIGKTGVSVKQIIKPEGAPDRIRTRIAYEIRNASNKAHKVGIRLLLDTWAGKNDGVPFLIPTGEATQLYRTEVEFTPTASVMWQIFDIDRASAEAQEPGLQNLLIGKDLVPPDRVAFANWIEAAKTLWDYAVNSARRVTGDSAVILWWQPAEIAPGKTQIVATELGAYLQKREPTVFVTNAEQGEILIYLWHYNNSDATQKVSYAIRAEKGDLRFQLDLTEQALGPKKTFVKATAGQVLVEGDTTIIITESINGTPKEYRYPISNLHKWKRVMGTPVAEPAKKFPVSYFDERDLTLRARLKAVDGRVVTTIPLEKSAIEGGFEYKGNFDIPPDAAPGRYTVEVVR